MNVIPHFCQNCGANNQLGELNCQKCGTRLMLVVFPASIRHEEGIVPSFYEDHLLERVTLLEIRLSQIAERLSIALDLLLQQTKTSQTDHKLLQNLLNSLSENNLIGTDNFLKKGKSTRKIVEKKHPKTNKIFCDIVDNSSSPNTEIFTQLITEGIKQYQQSEHKQALRNLEQALKLSPKNIPLLLFLAQIEFEAERKTEANKYLENAYSIEPNNQKVLLFYGLNLAELNEIEKAEKVLLKITENSSAKFCANYILGFIKAFEADWKRSLGYFKECFSINSSAEIKYLIGCVYLQLGKVNSAHQHFQESIQLNVNFADPWFMLAVIYQLMNDDAKSFQALEMAKVSKEMGSDYLKYMKKGVDLELSTALPFIRLANTKKNLITEGSNYLSKYFREEFIKFLNQ